MKAKRLHGYVIGILRSGNHGEVSFVIYVLEDLGCSGGGDFVCRGRCLARPTDVCTVSLTAYHLHVHLQTSKSKTSIQQLSNEAVSAI